jgi:DNA-binding IclR family transcriptional regulator
MSTTAKALQVLKLFGNGRSALRAGEVMQSLGVSSATAYRYLADLEDAGLLERSGLNRYGLGPAIVELDREIRSSDPLIGSADEVMKGLAERTGGSVLLARLHGHRVICVHAVLGRFAPARVSYERGHAMPLYRGATSRIILAHLPVKRLRELVRHDGAGLRAAGLPDSAPALVQRFAPLRDAAVCVSRAEVDADAVGIASPLHNGPHLLGSLSVVLASSAPTLTTLRLNDQVRRAARRIEARMAALP